MSKIIIKLSGGLGNQLHQFAFGMYLQKHIGCELFVDESFLIPNVNRSNITKRNLELHQFNLEKLNYSSTTINNIFVQILIRLPMINLLIEKVFKISFIFNNKIDINKLKKFKIIYLNSVFGTVSNCLEVREQINVQFKANRDFYEIQREVEVLITKKNSVAIHIRRADYLNHDSIHCVLDIEYYLRAIESIQKQLQNPIFYLFGDDSDWIKKELLNLIPYAIFIDRKGRFSSLFDFLAINYCENKIISNSTFAWWAAFVDNDPNAIIIAPSIWLKNDKLLKESTYPKEWSIV